MHGRAQGRQRCRRGESTEQFKERRGGLVMHTVRSTALLRLAGILRQEHGGREPGGLITATPQRDSGGPPKVVSRKCRPLAGLHFLSSW